MGSPLPIDREGRNCDQGAEEEIGEPVRDSSVRMCAGASHCARRGLRRSVIAYIQPAQRVIAMRAMCGRPARSPGRSVPATSGAAALPERCAAPEGAVRATRRIRTSTAGDRGADTGAIVRGRTEPAVGPAPRGHPRRRHISLSPTVVWEPSGSRGPLLIDS